MQAIFQNPLASLSKHGRPSFIAEGISHYSPGLAPLKSGVARMTSDVLRRNKDNPDFKLVLLTCSITYLHREAFRSDVLVSFNPPIELTIKDHYSLFANPRPLPPANGQAAQLEANNAGSIAKGNIDSNTSQLSLQPPVLDGVKQLTQLMYEQIRQATLDSPDFETVRIANTARRLYAPLGTQITLGDHVHITQRFIDVFAKRAKVFDFSSGPAEALMTPLPTGMSIPETPIKMMSNANSDLNQDGKVVEAKSTSKNGDYFNVKNRKASDRQGCITDEDVEQLKRDLHVSALSV